MKKTKSFKKISLGLFALIPLLSSCIFHFDTNTRSSNLDNLNSQVFHKTSDDLIYQNNSISISTAAKQAPDPTKCTKGDSCYYQYINDRSFSVSIQSDNNGDINGSYGTGWIIDREVNTNNFYVVSNIHVWSVADDNTPVDPIPDDQQPKIVGLKIGKQQYNQDLGNNQTESLVYSNYKTVKINFPEYFNDNNRILIETTGGPIQYKGENEYTKTPFYFDIKPSVPVSYLNSRSRIKDTVFTALWDESIKNAIPQSKSKNFAIRSYEYFFDTLETAFKDTNNGIFADQDIPQDAIIEAEELDDELKTKIDWKKTDSLEPNSKIRYIDGAVMKITIPDHVLANWLPYFLDPKLYNQWTFPNLAQSDIITLQKNQKNKKFLNYDSIINDEVNTKPLYHAGYPLEQVNGNLNYRSKSGPIFKTTKSILYAQDVSTTDNRALDHFQCDPTKMSLNGCGNNKVPIGSINIYTEDDYSTGGGSSGSMVIDKNYNTVAIYWGGAYDPYAKYTKSYHYGIQQPLYQSSSIDSSYQIINTSEDYEKGFFKKLLLNHFYHLFLKHSTNNLWNKYQKITDKTTNGLNFIDQDDLMADLAKLEKGIKTDSPEKSGTYINDQLKKDRIKNVIDNAYNLKIVVGKNQVILKEVLLEFLYIQFLKLLVFDLKGDNLVTPHRRGIRGVNFKKQLQEHFKKNNIYTYNLNKPTN